MPLRHLAQRYRWIVLDATFLDYCLTRGCDTRLVAPPRAYADSACDTTNSCRIAYITLTTGLTWPDATALQADARGFVTLVAAVGQPTMPCPACTGLIWTLRLRHRRACTDKRWFGSYTQPRVHTYAPLPPDSGFTAPHYLPARSYWFARHDWLQLLPVNSYSNHYAAAPGPVLGLLR